MPRCSWCGDDPIYVAYHDDEWGVPEHDARAGRGSEDGGVERDGT